MNINKIKQLVMGTEEAAAMWDLSQDHVKKLCRLGKCEAFLLGKSWVLLREQPNPKKERKSDA